MKLFNFKNPYFPLITNRDPGLNEWILVCVKTIVDYMVFSLFLQFVTVTKVILQLKLFYKRHQLLSVTY